MVTSERPSAAQHPRALESVSERWTADAGSLVELQQRERSRIAFDIHDGPAQSIVTALMQVKSLKDECPSSASAALGDLEQQLLLALEELYAAVEQLRNHTLDGTSLVAKIEALASSFSDRTGVPVSLEIDEKAPSPSDWMQIGVFQIVREALQNVARHSGARHVRVRLVVSNDRVSCSIEDDGTGFDLEAAGQATGRHGLGLMSMRERAQVLGGECRIASRPGAGCRVDAMIPLRRG